MLLLLIGNTILSLIVVLFLIIGTTKWMKTYEKVKLNGEMELIQTIMAQQEKIMEILSKEENHDK